jgi:hypothetical protein
LRGRSTICDIGDESDALPPLGVPLVLIHVPASVSGIARG